MMAYGIGVFVFTSLEALQTNAVPPIAFYTTASVIDSVPMKVKTKSLHFSKGFPF